MSVTSVGLRRPLGVFTSVAAAVILAGCTIPSSSESAAAPTTSASAEAASTSAEPEPAPEPALPLAGRVVFLDPGHSGHITAAAAEQVPTGRGGSKDCQTSGTSTDDGYPEHTAVFEIAQLIRADLEAQGATVILSRDDDASAELCNNLRAEAADKAGADAVVSLHADGAGPEQFGVYTSYSSPPLNDAQSEPAINLATDLRDAFTAAGYPPAAYAGQDGLMARDDLTGLNLSLRPTALVELGNMRNADDARMLTTPEGQARIAQTVASGIRTYLQSL